MRFKKLMLIGLVAISASNVQAANQIFNVKYRLAIMDDGRLSHKPQHQSDQDRPQKSEGVSSWWCFGAGR